jgi:hypothetical protein
MVFVDTWGGCTRNAQAMAQVYAPSLCIPQVEEGINLLLELCFQHSSNIYALKPAGMQLYETVRDIRD